MQFIAIDFETATSNYTSACSLGLAIVANGKIVDNVSWLIRPEPFEFAERNMLIHGIRPADVFNAPTFSEIWPEVYLYLQDSILVAHSASFDMSVLRSSLQTHGITPPPFKYACSLKVSRKVWPNLECHKLNYVANFLKLDFTHHDAKEDAYASAYILIEAAKALHVKSLDELYKTIGHKYGTLKPKK